MEPSNVTPVTTVLKSHLSHPTRVVAQGELNVILAGEESIVIVGQIELAREMFHMQHLESHPGWLDSAPLGRKINVYHVSSDALENITRPVSPDSKDLILL